MLKIREKRQQAGSLRWQKERVKIQKISSQIKQDIQLPLHQEAHGGYRGVDRTDGKMSKDFRPRGSYFVFEGRGDIIH